MGSKVLGNNKLSATAITASASAFAGGLGIDGPRTGVDPQGSVTYRGLFGEPNILTLSILSDASGGSGASAALSGTVQSVSTSVLSLMPDVSHPGQDGDPPYLLYVQATLAPSTPLTDSGKLRDVTKPDALGLTDYIYASTTGAPTWYWFAAIQDLSELQALGDPVALVKKKAGGALEQFGKMLTHISSALMFKTQ
ncbi:hypothetical protein LJR230_002294 [Trinickia sp. LjRoot230]|uniref:hypothetical protein n=1 Tax=Trinickia sp. LjRoot230 TaxID=3342288 RepID=UPI003ECCA1E5